MTVTAGLIALVCGAIGTYLARSGLILLLADRALPLTVERALANVGPAVLAALTINLAVGSDGIDNVPIADALALVVASAVAIWRRNLVWALIGGMVTLWIVAGVG